MYDMSLGNRPTTELRASTPPVWLYTSAALPATPESSARLWLWSRDERHYIGEKKRASQSFEL